MIKSKGYIVTIYVIILVLRRRHGDAFTSSLVGLNHPRTTGQSLYARPGVLLAEKLGSSPIDTTRNDTAKLWTYISNIQRQQSLTNRTTVDKRSFLSPPLSLAYFLEQHTFETQETDDDTSLVIEALSRATTGAIRAAASVNDYRLILRLVDAALAYVQQQPLIDPRILGEAVTGLSQTSASLSKIKTVWNHSTSQTLTKPVGPMEVNAMLQALAKQGKIKPVIDIYHTSPIDEYSTSIALRALADSIVDTQEPVNKNANRDESSVCWQWNTANQLLERSKHLNNPILTALLKINERAGHVFSNHKTSAMALYVWRMARTKNVALDVVACTQFLSQLDSTHSMELLECMRYDENLPKPNEYSYAAAISACAQARDSENALKLLRQLESDGLTANTVIYNTVLQSLTPRTDILSPKLRRKQRRQAKWKLETALNLLDDVEQPDTITCNMIFFIARALLFEYDWNILEAKMPNYFGLGASSELRFVNGLLDHMARHGISADSTTYRRAMSVSPSNILTLLDRAIQSKCCDMSVFATAMSIVSVSESSVHSALQIVARLKEVNVRADAATTVSFVKALCNGNRYTTLPVVLYATTGDEEAARTLRDTHGINVELTFLHGPSSDICATAISLALLAGDYHTANRIMLLMKHLGIALADKSKGEIARAYALSSMNNIHDHLNTDLLPTDNTGKTSIPVGASNAPAKAAKAYKILSTINEPSITLLALIAKACANSGMFDEARKVLHILHKEALSDRRSRQSESLHSPISEGQAEIILPKLHRVLLRHCAHAGNITASLAFVKDIQSLSKKFSWDRGIVAREPDFTFTREETFDVVAVSTQENITISGKSSFGMDIPDWKSLLIAASKSGHWKVCISTLQFIQPFLQDIHPSKIDSKPELLPFIEKRYSDLCPCLSIAAKCLEVRSQYGWLIRTIDDWIIWGGRRPPKGAVLSALRILSARGRANEINSLVTRCLQPKPNDCNGRDGKSYEIAVYVAAITCLYNAGMYDAADDSFVAAISAGILPLQLQRQQRESNMSLMLDLHGMNVAVAHSAVRVALQQELRKGTSKAEMLIVTGRGRQSALRMRPVLRPEIQRMLVEEFYPPLSTTSVPGNMGALLVPAEDIEAWRAHQRDMKGNRMLYVAAALKSLSSGSRIRAALTKARSTNTTKV